LIDLSGSGIGIGDRVISEDAARQLTWMMNKVVSEGTGQAARIDGWDIAGKTGTTQGAPTRTSNWRHLAKWWWRSGR